MGKLKSRKFWIAIIVIAYGVIMGVRSLNTDSQIVTIVCVAAAAVAGIAYLFAEAMVDSSEDTAMIEIEEAEDGD